MVVPVVLLFFILFVLLTSPGAPPPGHRRCRPRHRDGRRRRNSGGSHRSRPLLQLQRAACAGHRRACAGGARDGEAPRCFWRRCPWRARRQRGLVGEGQPACSTTAGAAGAASANKSLRRGTSSSRQQHARPAARQRTRRSRFSGACARDCGQMSSPRLWPSARNSRWPLWRRKPPRARRRSQLGNVTICSRTWTLPLARNFSTRRACTARLRWPRRIRSWTRPTPPSDHPSAVCSRSGCLTSEEGAPSQASKANSLCQWVGLPAFSVEFAAGVAAKNIAESMVALWRCPEGPDWTEGAERAARQVILDLAELGGAPAFPSRRERGASASAAAGAASGASASGPSMGVPFFVDWNAIARERGGGGCRGRVFVWVRRGGGRAARRCLWPVAVPPPASSALSLPRSGVASAAAASSSLALQQEHGEVSAEASVGVDRRFDEAGVLSRPESERVPNWNPARERQRCAQRQVFFRGARARVDQGPLLPWRAEKTPRRRGL